MASSCNVNGIIGLRNSRVFQCSPGKQFWKHNGFLPLRNEDLKVEVFTFGRGASAPLDEGVYFGTARVVARMTTGADTQTTEPVLQLFVNEVSGCDWLFTHSGFSPFSPFFSRSLSFWRALTISLRWVFVIVGKTSRSNLSADHNRAFDIILQLLPSRS